MEGEVKELKRGRSLQLWEDALFEIFIRLSARDLFRFKWICKSWYNLITSSALVECHLQHWNSHGGLTFAINNGMNDFELLHLSLDGETYPISKLYGKEATPKWIFNGDILDSCDGLLLLKSHFFNTGEEDLVMCNPITRSYILLPIPPLLDSWSYKNHGYIVYDDFVKRYKVVWRYEKYNQYYIMDVDTKSSQGRLISNWRKITSSEWRFSSESRGWMSWVDRESEESELALANVFFHGKLHWLMAIDELELTEIGGLNKLKPVWLKRRFTMSTPVQDFLWKCWYGIAHLTVRSTLNQDC
ncbi:hypothetical protein SAY87_006862 [Trapa incisa]|uniref:F-box domain-containing protein n=1 Tax=Trapa incisa TaxID=236973 RepID=A0AAN7JXK9_9MYRT|nr:hypothetical protein SAY87_006862 [Trapa incisa]